jgi:eukaryotic-like serine/threonine-protein kinase
MPVDAKRVQAVLLLAEAAADPVAQAVVLDRECNADPQLREQVEALLKARDKSAWVRATEEFRQNNVPPVSEGPGSRIGPFKVLQKLGEGGMGSVYLAEQEEPIRRRVALKIIKAGMDSEQVIARFEQERQALALMDHPHIAKVFDAGTTANGRPFFVMELVKGVPITTFCDQEHLTLKERLELFVPVCQAVQHSHQKGIIHRDLKPSNVLVALYDGKAVPKVIDFGVAKATSQKLTGRTLFTEVGQVVGTLEYVAPEQAELNNLDIDSRADIYALGALLYELLTGSTPFTRQQLRGGGFTEMLRMIRDVEPPRPSSKLSNSPELPAISAKRKLEPKRLMRLVHGDLDWIVMKCLEKERNRRYETANGLAMDIQRFLANEPVLAGPPSAAYRLQKFIQRNRGLVSAAGLLLLALLLGMAGTTWGLLRAMRAEKQANDERDLALAEKERASEQAANTLAINDFLTEDLLGQADPDRNGRDEKITVEELLRRAAKNIQSNPRFESRPAVEATLQLTIGKTFFKLGLMPEAESHLRRAVELRRQVFGLENADTLTAQETLADFLNRGPYKYAEAEPLARQTWQAREKLLGPEHRDTLDSLDTLAKALNGLPNHKTEAGELFRKCLAARQRTLGPHHLDTLGSMHSLATYFNGTGAWSEAIPLFREVLKHTQQARDSDSVLTTAFNLGLALFMQGELTEAAAILQENMNLAAKRFGPEHRNTDRQRGTLVRVMLDQGRVQEALPLLREVVATRRSLFRTANPLTAVALTELGRAQVLLGQWAEAEKTLTEAVQMFEKAPPPSEYYTGWAECWYGACLAGQQRFPEAEARLVSAERKLRGTGVTPTHHYMETLTRLSKLYDSWGKKDKADEWRRKAEDARVSPKRPDK